MSKPEHFRISNNCSVCDNCDDWDMVCLKHEFDLCGLDYESKVCDDFEQTDDELQHV